MDVAHIQVGLQWRIQSWSQVGFPRDTFKGLVKVSASNGVIRVDWKQSWPGGGVSGQPENPPGYATGSMQTRGI